MKCVVAAVGAVKKGPESELCQRYLKLNPWNVSVVDVDVDAKLPKARRLPLEAEKLRHAIRSKNPTLTFALDSRGKHITSEQLAELIGKAQLNRIGQCNFLIGGQDGLDPTLVKESQHVIAFGGVTWPHQLLRAMLMEQLYRAQTILAGHPYHSGH